MGSCVSSVYKGTAAPEPAKKITAPTTPFGSKSNKQVLPESPPTNDHKLFSSYGSKEEAFFDSQPWLESDAEDDFHSVRGDFTPSRGSTPVHHNFFIGTPQHNKLDVVEVNPSHPDSTPAEAALPSLIKKKKRLSELFQDSLRENLNGLPSPNHGNEDKIGNEQNNVEATTPNKVFGVNYDHGTKMIANDVPPKKAKSPKFVQYSCLSGLITCRPSNFRDRKRDNMMTVSTVVVSK
ncbi:Uncharacterized protein At3g27210 [Linum perenne]